MGRNKRNIDPELLVVKVKMLSNVTFKELTSKSTQSLVMVCPQMLNK